MDMAKAQAVVSGRDFADGMDEQEALEGLGPADRGCPPRAWERSPTEALAIPVVLAAMVHCEQHLGLEEVKMRHTNDQEATGVGTVLGAAVRQVEGVHRQAWRTGPCTACMRALGAEIVAGVAVDVDAAALWV